MTESKSTTPSSRKSTTHRLHTRHPFDISIVNGRRKSAWAIMKAAATVVPSCVKPGLLPVRLMPPPSALFLFPSLQPPATQRQDQMQGGAALEGVVGGGLVVGHLLAAENEALLDGRDALLLLDLLLDFRDLVVEVDVELNLLAGKRADPGRLVDANKKLGAKGTYLINMMAVV